MELPFRLGVREPDHPGPRGRRLSIRYAAKGGTRDRAGRFRPREVIQDDQSEPHLFRPQDRGDTLRLRMPMPHGQYLSGIES